MSVAVEIFLARHENVVTIPVAAVVEQEKEFLCWVETDAGVVQRSLKLGDSNDQFVVVEEGLEEGEHVVLNPLDFMAESQRQALKPVDKQESKDVKTLDDPGSQAIDGGDAKLPRDDVQSSGRKQAPAKTGAAIIKAKDKNGDGALTIGEVGEKSQSEFGTNDANGDGKLDVAEMDAAIKRKAQGDKD
jgi:hypothetical protein